MKPMKKTIRILATVILALLAIDSIAYLTLLAFHDQVFLQAVAVVYLVISLVVATTIAIAYTAWKRHNER